MTHPHVIREALSKLDPANDAHWTSQGLPRMDALAGLGAAVDRKELNEAVPGFTRAVAAEQRVVALANAPPSPPPEPKGEDYFAATTRHIADRAARHQAALEHLIKGGFTLKDLQPVRSKLDQAIAIRNRAARRAG